ncbi:MAG TPA: hypothetical protein VMW27_11160 [Thermoanaerobaculia bacterium]|nr:hypothetical protein [Thermoanaerobaculia bacterium]
MRKALSCLALAAVLAAPAALSGAEVDPDLLAGLKVRAIGPASMSGRVAAIEGVESNPDVLYVGAATGGVWKTVNGGLTWEPIFDDQAVSSVGAVAVFQPNPDIVWVGTGEGNPRNSVSFGQGVYRSLDGGRTWKYLGLAETERIHRVIPHPTDPDIAYVAAMGRLWGENPERGVFKTTDGGRTWKKVLYVDPRTGAADLVMDPQNPNKLFAALWDHRRQPWTFRSGGPGSGLYVTYDGGESWKRLTEDDGLPKGNLGRIGLAISRSNPQTVYALVEAGRSALIRSDDGGRTWKTATADQRVADRPFYYADIHVDPVWPNRVYSLASRITVSDDGGKTFTRLGRSNQIHGDYHALWINPNDPEHLVTGNDGGLGISRDRGATWYFPPNLPIAQYYHVAVDMDTPYNIYGGLQDNGSWRGPSTVWEEGSVRNQHWARVGGGDGFDTLPDPADSMAGYAMSQAGFLMRWNLRTGEVKAIRPPAPDPAERLRFNWNAGIAVDPFEPGTLYYGSQYLHKSIDRGETWTVISPDLTTDNSEWQKQAQSGGLTPDVTGAENFTTILAVAPSPLERGLIWVGTDDGRVQVTRDGGQSWTSVEKNIPGVPANTWVPHIRPSKLQAGSAFLVMDDHRRSNFTPYVFRTDDFGKTWKSLATPDLRGWALSIEQDPVDPDLLFLGTETGLYVSLDAGRRWMRWRHGLPTTPVADLVVHPRDHDLVIATHGRALYILDDLAPLRAMTPETLAEPLHVYAGGPAMLYQEKPAGGAARAGAGDFQGESRPYGALITYSLNAPGLPHPDEEKERARKEGKSAEPAPAKTSTAAPATAPAVQEDPAPPEEEGEDRSKGPKVEIRITDASGRLIRKMEGPAKLGVNRAVWDLRRDEFRQPPRQERGGGDDEAGPRVPPGTYTVTVKHGGREAQGTVRVVADPFTKSTDADWQAWEAAIRRVGELQNAVVEAIDRIGATRKDIDAVVARLDEQKKAREREGGASQEDPHKALRQSARDLRRKLSDTERRLFTPPDTRGIVDEEGTVLSQVEYADYALQSSFARPNATQQAYLAQAEAMVAAALADVNRVFAEDVAAFRRLVSDAGVGWLPEQPPLHP